MNEGKTRTHLDLFSGIGGFALAARWAGYQTIAFCEQDEYCQRVLERHWPEVPCLNDVHDLDGKDYEGVSLVTGGFPCQPYSHAGKRRGKDDDRAIGGEMVRIISEARPAWVLGENVSGFATMGLDDMLSDLESLGYACQTLRVPACAVDAPHRRDRLWIVAYSHSDGACRRGNQLQVLGESGQRGKNFEENRDPDVSGKNPRPKNGGSSEDVSHSLCEGRARTIRQGIQGGGDRPSVSSRWLPEPDVGRVAHGVPRRVDRIKGLGNAIVPHVAYEIIKEMI